MAFAQESLRDPSWNSQDRCLADNCQPRCRVGDLSRFEKLFSTHPPILESLLLQLPTPAVLQLYHASRYLRSFLQTYPIAWSHLSFRLVTAGAVAAQGSTGSESSTDQRRSRPYALDQLLLMVVTPFGTRLKTLDLDNTAVSGYVLTSAVLPQRRDTLTHLSVRGCKNVSLKYHIVPYLTVFRLQKRASGLPSTSQGRSDLVLKSIYTYRCRHHRRRPYLPQSLIRRDSDSDHTHELVKLCHELGIWTDTAWCPTPGGRCLRRREYHIGRSAPGPPEVWVVFDRLWRSGNRIGDTEENRSVPVQPDGRLWEQDELGYDGEALGTGEGRGSREGKMTPAHLRQSHRVFVDGIKCDGCGDPITERCEQCSVRMHCLGCRKTLCGSCAFDRPLPRKKRRNQYPHSPHDPSPKYAHQSTTDLWWAPEAYQSPNLMQEVSEDGEIVVIGPNFTTTDERPPPKLKFQWCCLEPMFSGGGGIAFVGPGMHGSGANRIRTAPLPRGQGWEDPEFVPSMMTTFPVSAYGDKDAPDYTSGDGHNAMLRWLLRGSEEHQGSSCPRSLCQECYNSMGWQAACHACKRPLCLEHDLRGRKMRICGYRDLSLEDTALRKPAQDEVLSTESPLPPTYGPDHLTHPQAINIARKILGGLSDALRTQFIASLVVLPDEDDDEDLLDTTHDSTKSIRAPSNAIENDDEAGSPSEEPFHSQPQQPQQPQQPHPSNKATTKPWQGCATFFCQQFRLIGDHRNRCAGDLRVCRTCGVHVCLDCIAANPACDCTWCGLNYYCPNCYPKLDVGICRKGMEALERMRKAKEASRARLAAALASEQSDEIAGQLGEFFTGLEILGD